MSKLGFLSISLLAIFALSSVTAEASNGEATRSTQLAQTWKSLNIEEPGVYVHDDSVFVMVSRPWELSNTSAHRRWATPQIGQRLYQWAVDGSGVSETEKRLLHSSNASITVTGHSVFSGKDGDRFISVYAFDKTKLDEKIKAMDFEIQAQEAALAMIDQPEKYVRVFDEYRFTELALLSALKSYDGKLFSVTAPKTRLRDFAVTSQVYYEARDAVIGAQHSPISNILLYRTAWNCVDDPKSFYTELSEQNVELLPTQSRHPVMSQVKSCQGFVVFDRTLSAKEPVMMPRIKALFVKGQDLELATYLLEQAVEESPRSPLVWEYLTAAYEAAQNTEAAKLTSRVWFLLDESSSHEAFFKVLSQQKDTASEQYQFFSNLINR